MLAHLIQHNTCKGIGAYMCITHQRQYFSCDPHSRICFVFINFVIHYFSNFHIYVFIDLIFLKDIQQLHFQTYYFKKTFVLETQFSCNPLFGVVKAGCPPAQTRIFVGLTQS
jgi:hypothetical protein